jgi:hypothetical protein
MAIVGEYVEAETRKGADALERRPQLAAALAARVKITMSGKFLPFKYCGTTGRSGVGR